MITVLLRGGTETTLAEWQKIYGLPVGSDKIGKYFSLDEGKFAENLRDYKKLVICEPLMMIMDRTREIRGVPSIIKGFNRSEDKQKKLRDDPKFEAAQFSPHVEFMAVDTDTETKEETMRLVGIIDRASKELGIVVRIGSKQYLERGQTFVHTDVCPEYYAEGKPFHNKPHPWQWENPARW